MQHIKPCLSLLCLLAVFTGCGGSSPSPGHESPLPGGSQAAAESMVPPQFAAGAEVYAANCGLCHDKGEEGAPRIGNPFQWENRVAQGEATLTQHAFEGFEDTRGEMPPQGDHLTANEVSSAVQYILFRYELARKTK